MRRPYASRASVNAIFVAYTDRCHDHPPIAAHLRLYQFNPEL
jgi:hypothetical protein